MHSFLKLINFNWMLITLKYCDGFCNTMAWINHGCTCVLIPNPLPAYLPSHPSGLSQRIGFECPVSCIELGLGISFTYGNIHVSMLFSQSIPLLLSHTESKSLFFISVSFFCLAYRVVVIIFLNSIYMH